jgi:hypothetical protein
VFPVMNQIKAGRALLSRKLLQLTCSSDESERTDLFLGLLLSPIIVPNHTRRTSVMLVLPRPLGIRDAFQTLKIRQLTVSCTIDPNARTDSALAGGIYFFARKVGQASRPVH